IFASLLIGQKAAAAAVAVAPEKYYKLYPVFETGDLKYGRDILMSDKLILTLTLKTNPRKSSEIRVSCSQLMPHRDKWISLGIACGYLFGARKFNIIGGTIGSDVGSPKKFFYN